MWDSVYIQKGSDHLPTVSQFTDAVLKNAARVKKYVEGGDGSGGKCDCVGLIIGAERLLGIKYSGIHGSNYFARHFTAELRRVTKADQLVVGQVVYKAKEPGSSGYDLPRRYDKDPDRNDYYHIGYVLSVHPLKIVHCSAGGIHYDTKLRKWNFAGYIKGVDYMGISIPEPQIPDENGPAYVDVPNDGTVNIRAAPRNNAKIQDRIREGTTVEVLAFEGEWAKVEYKCTGYVMTKFLREEGVQDDVG